MQERVQKSSAWNPPSPTKSSQFAPRPYSVKATQDAHRPPTREAIEQETSNQNRSEVFRLQRKEKHGTITPVEQERLGVLQAKMDDARKKRLARAKAQPNLLEILIRNSQATQTTEPLVPVQPKLTVGQQNNSGEQEVNQVTSQGIQQINTPVSTQSSQGESVKRTEVPEDKEQQATPGHKGTESSKRVNLRVTPHNIIQLVYLRDRTQGVNAPPVWTEEGSPPSGYIESGKHNDGIHGEDKLYEKLGGNDLFYGINYEESEEFENFINSLSSFAEKRNINTEERDGLANALALYEAEYPNHVMLDVELYKAIFGGSSGWNVYSNFLEGQGAFWGKQVQQLNPGLNWAPLNSGAKLPCQMSEVSALYRGGSVRFIMDGMKDAKGILSGTKYPDKVTTAELVFAADIVGKTIIFPDKKQIDVREGVNVFFYLRRHLVPMEVLYLLNDDSVQSLAERLGEKIAEEEEWDEDDQADLEELQKMLQDAFSIPQLLELLHLP